jgi:hypothetical protein
MVLHGSSLARWWGVVVHWVLVPDHKLKVAFLAGSDWIGLYRPSTINEKDIRLILLAHASRMLRLVLLSVLSYEGR